MSRPESKPNNSAEAAGNPVIPSANYAAEFRSITKTFGTVVANEDVSLNVRQGEILALLGENGSGKTTRMNMLSGIYMPDSGSIFIDGKEVSIRSPEDGKRLGVGMVHQHFKLVDVLSVADNIWLGAETPAYRLKDKLRLIPGIPSYSLKQKLTGIGESGFKRFLKRAGLALRAGARYALNALKRLGKAAALILCAAGYHIKNEMLSGRRFDKIQEISRKFGFEIDPKKKVYNMSVSEKQTAEIIKVLYYGADIIILDEPTAVLTVQETDKLFGVLRKMKAGGHSIIIITHKLNEVMAISDRVAVMRKGRYIDTVTTGETSPIELTELMVGKKVDLKIERTETNLDRPLLEIRDLIVKSDEGATAIDSVSFYIRGGELLGVAGISGCGQRELCEAIAGLRPVVGGSITHKGVSIVGVSPKQIIAKGISMSFIPEDRLGMGLAPSLSITDNMILKTYADGFRFNPFVNRKSARADAERVIRDLGVITPSAETPVRRLSGGNVQKVLVGREIKAGPNVIVTAYPVRGLDINSSYAIYNILNEQKKNGVGILFIGEDLDVMLELCDKILVLCRGRVMGVVHARKTTKEEIGLMMTGGLDKNEIKKHKHYGVAKDGNTQGGTGA
ncbi:MAG: ABC transporter ATP-binding protein [Clostridiales bacterium]|jgi:simple sugar transport system ATP-binding protein|nr:ABC transporter ATP-binding protein [Clostridiales bacterium]